jgi:hypothetical protein
MKKLTLLILVLFAFGVSTTVPKMFDTTTTKTRISRNTKPTSGCPSREPRSRMTLLPRS